jgi:4-hydroxybenzoate polyprenyltransferase
VIERTPTALPPAIPYRERTRAFSLWRELLFCVKASRPGFYLTAIWFYLLPLGDTFPLQSSSFWLGLFYVALPLGLLIYAGNDVTDQDTDELNPRKDSFLFGARPTPEQIVRLPWLIALVQLPFVLWFFVLLGPRALLWFVALVAMTLLYNAPRFAAKDRPGFDVLAQVGYLLVFVLSNWLNNLPQAPWFIFVFGALFAMHSHLFGQIMDVAPDSASGRRTTAVAIGIRASKYFIVALLLIEAVIASQITDKPYLTWFLLGSAGWFLLDVLVLWRDKAYLAWQMTAFFIGWNLLLLLEIAWNVIF